MSGLAFPTLGLIYNVRDAPRLFVKIVGLKPNQVRVVLDVRSVGKIAVLKNVYENR